LISGPAGYWVVFIQWGRPNGLPQFSKEEAVKICFT